MMKTKKNPNKVEWSGKIVSVQPRIRLVRSFDERSHSYLGYVLRVEGTVNDETGEFLAALGKGAQAKHRFQVGYAASGQAVPVPDPRLETAGFYKVSGLKILKEAEGDLAAGPPFHGVPLAWKPIAVAGTGVWTSGPMMPGARPVSGAAGCRWR